MVVCLARRTRQLRLKSENGKKAIGLDWQTTTLHATTTTLQLCTFFVVVARLRRETA